MIDIGSIVLWQQPPSGSVKSDDDGIDRLRGKSMLVVNQRVVPRVFEKVAKTRDIRRLLRIGFEKIPVSKAVPEGDLVIRFEPLIQAGGELFLRLLQDGLP